MCSFRLKAGLRTLSLGAHFCHIAGGEPAPFAISNERVEYQSALLAICEAAKTLALDSGNFTVGLVSTI
jgi:hypothetical protein